MLTSVICLVCKLCNKIKSLWNILEQNNCLPKKISVSTIQAKFRYGIDCCCIIQEQMMCDLRLYIWSHSSIICSGADNLCLCIILIDTISPLPGLSLPFIISHSITNNQKQKLFKHLNQSCTCMLLILLWECFKNYFCIVLILHWNNYR